jgi:ABC-2 type transport system ATP-binding protein|tara:strand:+ start:414 stop:662 length:249 start_codon:yes stop_codon:yes gene_type:complete
VIAGILKLGKGQITVNGSVSILFDIGLGMEDHLTGYENIIIRGLLLGIAKKNILKDIDKIVDLTELGCILNLPIHIYAVGMS